ncbi:MAG: mannitol dehydrogenase family protein [Eubacteriales bacterium]|nr:mannitol dehydrogenase family protein [Eubacteriales bacterium]
MELTLPSLLHPAPWQQAEIRLPGYDLTAVRQATAAAPTWVHFGAGNIFRGFIAMLSQRMLQSGLTHTGVIAAETFDFDIVTRVYAPHDLLSLVVGLHADGQMDREVLGSITEALRTDDAAQLKRLFAVFAAPTLQMASFTITEKGYAVRDLAGEPTGIVKEDIEAGPEHARHAMSVVTALLLHRYRAGAAPIAMVSMDNCSHNGEKLQSAVVFLAEGWVRNGFADKGFLAYLQDPARVSFPWSMIDKITPRPAEAVEKALEALGVEGVAPIVTGRGTYIAPFVNAEIPQYLVVEDAFPAGRPPLEKVGVYMTTRDTVNRVERMKVTTCLNPLHTALAVYGCLLGYTSIADEMRDPELTSLIRHIGYDESMPVVTDPGILNPRDFLNEVLTQRFPNPFIPDTPQRIATDTSQKIAIRYGETIKAYLASDTLNVRSLTFIPLALAGWLRYLLGVDDALNPFERSGDPLLAELTTQLEGIAVGSPETATGKLAPILSNELLFGVDLCKAGLADKVEGMFRELIAGKGAIRATLRKYTGA